MSEHTMDTMDIEVGRYAVRTFRIDRRRRILQPVNPSWRRGRGHESPWRNGACRAVCNHDRAHDAPAEECGCGIYGATSLESLRAQYPVLASNIVAVIAAEGTTIVGSRGLRTQAARVVAYWCHPSSRMDTAGAVIAEQCPAAERFADLDQMLAVYGLRYTSEPETPTSVPAAVDGLRRVLATGHTYGFAPRALAALRTMASVAALVGFPALVAWAFTHLAAQAEAIPLSQYANQSSPDRALVGFISATHGFMSALIAADLAWRLTLTCMAIAMGAAVIRWGPTLFTLRPGGRTGLRMVSFFVTYTMLIGGPVSWAWVAIGFIALGAYNCYLTAYLLRLIGTMIAGRVDDLVRNFGPEQAR
ncbi:hypothetical protein CKJ66_26225 [Mycobacterium avium]|uniref:Uncharacterized protein n=1 Tax=Mycobacterium avium TaxID=1764 RepID=A0A2A2ZBC3_MYCAV|nr:hypothetical protein [Mycobacterium avium]PBA23764.1 hypothetical protein CKJ66_26225 [Mycobacterium avium]